MTGTHIYNDTFNTRRLDPDPSEDLQPHVHTVSPHRRISASLMALLSRAWLWVYGTYGLVGWLRRVPARDRPRRPPNRVISSYRESAARDGPMDQFELAAVIKAFIWSKGHGQLGTHVDTVTEASIPATEALYISHTYLQPCAKICTSLLLPNIPRNLGYVRVPTRPCVYSCPHTIAIIVRTLKSLRP